MEMCLSGIVSHLAMLHPSVPALLLYSGDAKQITACHSQVGAAGTTDNDDDAGCWCEEDKSEGHILMLLMMKRGQSGRTNDDADDCC